MLNVSLLLQYRNLVFMSSFLDSSDNVSIKSSSLLYACN
uniref:Uncharacterized protein n=1 Tax=Arundo donax TaxID=35708 RepID=A0A0A8XTA8_ARUDO